MECKHNPLDDKVNTSNNSYCKSEMEVSVYAAKKSNRNFYVLLFILWTCYYYIIITMSP